MYALCRKKTIGQGDGDNNTKDDTLWSQILSVKMITSIIRFKLIIFR